MIDMSHHPFPTHPSQATGLRRDVTWGRILFVPPELVNPRIVFDPVPFRSHSFAPARTRKSPYTR